MSDPNVEVTSSKGGCQGFIGSIIAAFIGLGLFLGSFYVLFSNEQKTDFSKVAQKAIMMAADQQQPSGKAGDLVAITGELKTDNVISVDEFIIPAKYIAMMRSTEMYAWEEESTSEKKGDKTVTKYSYHKEWTSMPDKSSSFHNPSGHSNPSITIEDKKVEASKATIGNYSVSVPDLDVKSVSEPMTLDETTVNKEVTNKIVNGKYLYFSINSNNTPVSNTAPVNQNVATNTATTEQKVESNTATNTAATEQKVENNTTANTATAEQKPVSKPVSNTVAAASMSNPQVGDQRVEYDIIPATVQGTIFASISGTDLVPYITEKKEKFLSFRKGNFDEAVDALRGEYLTSLWLMRGLGFGMMLIGMLMFFGPLFNVLDIIPILGDFAGGLLFVVLLVVALILTGITIFAGFLFKNIVYVIAFVAILVIIGIAITVILLSIARKRKA